MNSLPASAAVPAPSPTPSSAPRYPGMDWLRVFASLAVVVLHAGMPYMSSPMPNLIWCTEDRPARTDVIDALGWNIDTFVMPLFFLMGGFLARPSCLKMGPKGFARHRALRLGIPFVIAFCLVMPAVFYTWLLGWVCEDRIIARKLRSLKIGDELSAQLMGPGHLWFLLYMLVFCVGAALVVSLWNRRSAAAEVSETARPVTIPLPRTVRLVDRLAITLGLFVVSAAALYWKPLIVIGFRQAILPQIPNILYYSPAFGLGWLLHRWNWQPARWTASALVAGSLVLFFGGLWRMIAQHAAAPFEGSDLLRLTFAFTACGWLMAIGLFAGSLRYAGRVPAVVDYLSRASLWIYLAHVPSIALTQISLRLVEGNGVWKTALGSAVGLTFCLLTYEAAVRGRRLETLLNGPSAAKRPVAAPVPEKQAA